MPAACLLGSAAVPGCLPLLAAPAAMAGPMPPEPLPTHPPSHLLPCKRCRPPRRAPAPGRVHPRRRHPRPAGQSGAQVAAPCRAAPPGQQQAQQPSGPVAGLIGNMLLCQNHDCLRSEHLASPPSLLHTHQPNTLPCLPGRPHWCLLPAAWCWCLTAARSAARSRRPSPAMWTPAAAGRDSTCWSRWAGAKHTAGQPAKWISCKDPGRPILAKVLG